MRVNGMSIAEFTALSVARAVAAVQRIRLTPREEQILRMRFGALNDGHPDKHRLDARKKILDEVVHSVRQQHRHHSRPAVSYNARA